MKLTKKHIAGSLALLVLAVPFVFSVFILPTISFAQVKCSDGKEVAKKEDCTPISTTLQKDIEKGRIHNPLGKTSSIPELINKVLLALIALGKPIIILAIIYCGFLFVAARGKSEAITKAKQALLYTLIGGAILLGAITISTIITSTVDSLK